MQSFADRLRSEIEYSGLLQKEVAAKAGIKKRALDMYLGRQGSMPPADVAVRLANVLRVSVEYLVTGKNPAPPARDDVFRRLEDDLSVLPEDVVSSLCDTIHKLVQSSQKLSGLSPAARGQGAGQ